MGLNHPRDLEAWQRWQASQSRLRRLKQAIRPSDPPSLVLEAPEGADVLIAHDSWSPTSGHALTAPGRHLDAARVAHLHPPGRHLTDAVPVELTATDVGVPDSLRGVRVVVALGHFLGAGRLAHGWALALGVPFVTVQHGLLAPSMAPLAVDTVLLAWTAEDADFWRSGRADVESHVVGSQLLWSAAQRPGTVADERPVFLGQLHGAELPRRGFARASQQFCRATGATYRPHPAEKDKLSRLQHALWERRGMEIDRDGGSLSEIDRPVASVFSTGVLEAAARGLPAWVHYDRPPEWLSQFWERYGMSRWGRDPHPTQPRGIPEGEPARRVAALIEEMAKP
ncbi:RNA-binding protein [Ornithinimicrobium cryptoxanthini]|uniref:RNA-binding protein n=1 Tax=Ornithinimicrobium cryptoxanthini TaxID=2934161 RepID=UPI0021175A81|nr:RNA-binding protein [Ornithinimicrobium cryptoxanthini]